MNILGRNLLSLTVYHLRRVVQLVIGLPVIDEVVVNPDGSVTVGGSGGTPTWTVLSDCRNSATAYTGLRSPATGQISFPVRRLIYSFSNNQILMGTGSGNPAQQVLVNNVSAFNVTFGVASSATDVAASTYSTNPGDPARIRSVRLSLTLADPNNRVRNQTFNVVAALRNRLQ